ncbi:MAG: lamin tail domain-containing protein [Pirellulales bacterium]|nr:lamin tail domain-containing protein [Pirellulales bacterium]
MHHFNNRFNNRTAPGRNLWCFRHTTRAGRRSTRFAGPKHTAHSRLKFEPLEPRLVLDAGPVQISEFLANNDSTLADEDGVFSDWLEIHNSSQTPVRLAGWYLTDDAQNLTKWQFPDVTLDPAVDDGYLIVFASGNNRRDPFGELHTNFKLDAGGESIALVMPDGVTVAHAYWDFPRQLEDMSYGLPDSTTVWDTLVASGAAARYHVPSPGEDVFAWTAPDYDDSAWTDTVSLPTPDLVVTEVEAGEVDWLEVQNVSAQPIDTTGWLVAVNDTSGDDINAVHEAVWDLPASIAGGEVLYRTDNAADHYWGSDIAWETGSGWVMIVDDAGQVVDFVAWGYDEAEIASVQVSVGPWTGLSVGSQWSGRGVPGGAGQVELVGIEQNWAYEESNTALAVEWRGVGYDDSPWDRGDALLYVEGSALPAPKNTPLTLGATTYYFRSHFQLDANPASVAQLDLRPVIDDGAIVYLNGVEVFRLGMDPGPFDHFTFTNRSVGDAVYEGPFTLPTGALVTGDNVLAVEVHQTNAGSSDVVMGLELEAAVLEPALQRVGNSDVNDSGNFALPAAPSKGVQNPGLSVPFVPGTVPARTGVGYSDDGDFDDAVRTDVAASMHELGSSLWSRIEFPAGDTTHFDVLTLAMQYDDGFVAYLNGVEVARRNAPELLAADSAATAEHPDAQAVVFEEINISDDLGTLRPAATNVLALHGLNLSPDDGDFLMLPELIAKSDLDGPQYMTTPTPRGANVAGTLGLVADTQFSADRGFYDEPFTVEIACDTLAAEIRYTRDSSAPTAATGTVYSGPISIHETTTLRAAAFKPGYISSNVDTQTYVFLAEILEQPSLLVGFPDNWGREPADYEMDPEIVDNPLYTDRLMDDMLSIPTMSLVMDPEDVFGATGIYANPNGEGAGWERAGSIEMFYPDGYDALDNGFQVDCGVRIYGGVGRNPGYKKHSFRLLFKDDYGPTKLNYPLFGDDAADRFDTIILRHNFNDGYVWGGANSQYVRDEYVRQLQLALGDPSAHGTFVHLYVNGLYWGLYNPAERPEASFSATYFGGEKEQWDAINSGAATGDSSTASWNALLSLVRQGVETQEQYQRLQGNNADGTNDPAYEAYLDVENYAHYMLLNFFVGNQDWPGHNWYAARQRGAESTGFKSFAWDSEWVIGMNSGLTSNRTGVGNSLGEPYAYLRQNEEFCMLFADLAHRALFAGGPLYVDPDNPQWDPAHPERNRPAALYAALADQVEGAIVCESARWGDVASGSPYTLTQWQSQRDWILNTYMPQRSAIVLQQLRDAGLYPLVSAPVLSRHGGQVDPGFGLEMTVTVVPTYQDTVVVPEFTQADYFVPANDDLGTTWTQWAFDTAGWSSGMTGLGYEDSSGYEAMIRTEVRPHAAADGSTSILLRIPFTIDNLDDVDRLLLRMKYDDGFVAYLNGQEVARRGISGTPSWNSQASNHEASGFEDIDVSAHLGALVLGGQNVLAIHAINQSTGSSDMIVLPELVIGTLIEDPDGPDLYYTLDGSDPRLVGGGVSPSALLYDGTPIAMTHSAVLKTRTHQSGQWSALNEAEFFVGPQATAEHLVVSEINYNPYPPTPEETAAGYTDNNAFEFVELVNRSGETIDLAGLAFVDGIQFDFAAAEVTELGPGEYLVVVADPAAFALRYETAGMRIAGQYTGALDNAGETVELIDWRGEAVVAFAYDDSGAWPGRADGNGSSLEMIDPAAVPTEAAGRTLYLEDGDHWRSSGGYGGSPGSPGEGLRSDVLINEVLSHTDDPLTDSIELYNSTAAAIELGGWYLSDSGDSYLKFRIADGTTIPAGGYLIFDEDDFNPTPLSPGPGDFALDGAHGDDVWLMEADAAGKPVRFVDHVDFPAAPNGESFGRWPNGRGTLYPMRTRTLDPLAGENSGPRIGPVVISEVHYNPGQLPGADDLEFVEIYNATSTPVDLTNWRIRKGVDYEFPDGTLLESHTVLVVVPFDPDDADKLPAFRTHYGLDESVTLLGGYRGRLDDGVERVQLQRPDAPPPDEPDFIPRLLEDEVCYDDQLPWPLEADGTGSSLQRLAADAWGNDGSQWAPAPPTPGAVPFTPATEVAGRYVFYNHSAFDGNDAAPNALDDGAIAPDKTALLPGRTASFANYTGYSRGINGIMIDLAHLPDGAVPGPADFRFRVGNSNDPQTWADAPAPSSITLRDGPNDTARVTIVFDDYIVLKQWLQVTVWATGNTGLAGADVFYFGNAVGEAGNSDVDAKVNAVDMLLARNNPRSFINPAPIDFPCDLNRDARVNATDMLLARNNQTHFLNALQLISVPLCKAVADGPARPSSDLPETPAWLYELALANLQDRPRKADYRDEDALDKLLAGDWP